MSVELEFQQKIMTWIDAGWNAAAWPPYAVEDVDFDPGLAADVSPATAEEVRTSKGSCYFSFEQIGEETVGTIGWFDPVDGTSKHSVWDHLAVIATLRYPSSTDGQLQKTVGEWIRDRLAGLHFAMTSPAEFAQQRGVFPIEIRKTPEPVNGWRWRTVRAVFSIRRTKTLQGLQEIA